MLYLSKIVPVAAGLLAFHFFLLYLVSSPIFVNILIKCWEPVNYQIQDNYEVGAVLTGGMAKRYDPLSKHIWLGKSGDRAVQAFELYKKGKIKKIIISGGSTSLRTDKRTQSENDGIRQYLIDSGVDSADIFQEAASQNTRDNALNTARVLHQQFRTNKCVLITSAFHIPRAVGCFKKAGVEVVPFPAHYMHENHEFWIDKLFPSEEALVAFYYVWHEMIGFVIYKLMGYV
ncbi:MAG: YdcF family protein [Spirosomataceae bacterium]